ncbi:GNAT family N-acetyltransferase [Amnibacterium sp. CER49]|uniref:GNAT family N-acetyltransferase n=1 Tax=Amnibacterium sp. CER49 TaxID=3039161 RepID=UPI0024477F7A|nr:GNAT family N-acetyltransferase [Amnibacterium sp. CER49]MDH2444559.1 GNAT family N-acetyltransferase [Amnibacterium sp. CER49]
MTDLSTVVLRPLRHGDAPVLASWGRDEVFRRAAGWSLPDGDNHLRYFERAIEAPRRGVTWLGAVEGERVVGVVELTRLSLSEIELGFSIGPSSNWGRGLGGRMVRAALELAGRSLGARIVRATTEESNERCRRTLARAGFHEVDRDGPTLRYVLELAASGAGGAASAASGDPAASRA